MATDILDRRPTTEDDAADIPEELYDIQIKPDTQHLNLHTILQTSNGDIRRLLEEEDSLKPYLEGTLSERELFSAIPQEIRDSLVNVLPLHKTNGTSPQILKSKTLVPYFAEANRELLDRVGEVFRECLRRPHLMLKGEYAGIFVTELVEKARATIPEMKDMNPKEIISFFERANVEFNEILIQEGSKYESKPIGYRIIGDHETENAYRLMRRKES